MLRDLDELTRDIGEWLDHQLATLEMTRPGRELQIHRIRMELDELLEAVAENQPVADELADVLIATLAMCYLNDIRPSSAITHKMTVNKARKWRKIGPGLIQHC